MGSCDCRAEEAVLERDAETAEGSFDPLPREAALVSAFKHTCTAFRKLPGTG